MKLLIILLFSFLILISCNNQSKKINKESDFNLITDYAEFQKKMNDQDTIDVWVAVPSCFPPIQVEKLSISKKNKQITINTSFNDDINKPNNYILQSKMILSENDTLWKFDEFLKKTCLGQR